MSLYTHTESVETRQRQALEFHLKDITAEKGYKNTIRQVFNEYPSRAQITDWPAVAAIWGEETVVNSDISDDLWHIELPLFLIGYVQDGHDMPIRKERLKLDLLKKFGVSWQLPGEDGVETCMLMSYKRGSRPGMKINNPEGVVVLEFLIQYRPDINDPTVIG